MAFLEKAKAISAKAFVNRSAHACSTIVRGPIAGKFSRPGTRTQKKETQRRLSIAIPKGLAAPFVFPLCLCVLNAG